MFRAKYVGGHPNVAKKYPGQVLFDNEKQELVFLREADRQRMFEIPYQQVTAVSADEKARRRVKETVILGVTLIGAFALPLLLSKKKMRFVLVEFRDPERQPAGAVLFRVKRRHKFGMMVAIAERADLERRDENLFAREGALLQTEAAEGAEPSPSATSSEQAPEHLCLLSVTSWPETADVQLDGEFVGSTPLTLRLPPGKYEITVKKEGFDDWTRRVQVLADNDTNLVAELSRLEPR